MASLAEIREALRTTLKAAIPELNVYAQVPDVSQLPAAVVLPASPSTSGFVCDFNGAFGRGLDTWHLDLYVLVSRAESVLAQQALDKYVTGSGPKSVRRIVYEVPDLGLTDGTDAHAEGIRNYGGEFSTAQVPHVGAVVRLTVRTSST